MNFVQDMLLVKNNAQASKSRKFSQLTAVE